MAVKNSLQKVNNEQGGKLTISGYLGQEKIKTWINGMIGTEKEAQKFISSIISAVSTTPTLQTCEQSSIVSAALLANALDLSLSPQLGLAYNGTEFTTPANAKEETMHIMDILLNKLRIRHKLIKPRTPRHNGKVERSHRSDQEAFYNHLTFYTLDELQEKMGAWLNRYNDRPHSQLRNKEGKRVWYSPRQKRAELLEILKECRGEYRVRFIKPKAA